MQSASKNQHTQGQVIALAGILQCAYLVDQIARTGHAPAESFNPTINSLFTFQVDNPVSVYGSIHGIQTGLKILHDLLASHYDNDYKATIRYSLGLINLQKSAASKNEMMSIIRSRLEHTAIKAEHFTDNIEEVAGSCAAVYQDTISTLRYRIHVQGHKQQLQNPRNASNIRALLLAGIRATTLWRQLGGKRWHLIVSRKRLIAACQHLIEN